MSLGFCAAAALPRAGFHRAAELPKTGCLPSLYKLAGRPASACSQIQDTAARKAAEAALKKFLAY